MFYVFFVREESWWQSVSLISNDNRGSAVPDRDKDDESNSAIAMDCEDSSENRQSIPNIRSQD